MPESNSKRSCRRAVALSVVVLATSAAAADAHAQEEPRGAREPRVMVEPGETTNVIDAADDLDPWDASISLGFEYANKSARILRETSIFQPGLTTGNTTSGRLNVANYSETTTRLVPKVELGIFHDLAAVFRVPIVLTNSRSLEDLDGSAGKIATVAQGAPGETLFSLPFKAPERSGIEYLAAGLQFTPLNQFRDKTKPTWLLGIEGRFAVGTPMHACNAGSASGEVECADPSDINRNGASDGDFEGVNAASPRSAGITRGTTGLEIRTVISKRIKYVEPYGGFSALFEFQNGNSDYGISDAEGTLVNHPPIVGTVLMGVQFIPWEDRERFNRLTFDLRFAGTYTSEGRDYSELFDALGSSNAPSLRQPLYERYQDNPRYVANDCADGDLSTPCRPHSIIDSSSEKTYFSGLTVVQAHGSARLSAGATWQASEYVKFSVGLGYKHDQAHVISGDQPCNPAFKDGSLGESGPCTTTNEFGVPVRSNGKPNPNYRAVINNTGRRFRVDSSNTVDFFLGGTVMF